MALHRLDALDVGGRVEPEPPARPLRCKQSVPPLPGAKEVGLDACSAAQLADAEEPGTRHAGIVHKLDRYLTTLSRVCTFSGRNLDRKERKMKKLDVLAGILVVVGALNWGLVAIAEFDLVATLFGLDFGETNAATRVIYGLVGAAAVYEVVQWSSMRRRWSRTPAPAAA